jgi:hypothetical protein
MFMRRGFVYTSYVVHPACVLRPFVLCVLALTPLVYLHHLIYALSVSVQHLRSIMVTPHFMIGILYLGVQELGGTQNPGIQYHEGSHLPKQWKFSRGLPGDDMTPYSMSDNRCSMYFWNVGTVLPDYTASHTKYGNFECKSLNYHRYSVPLIASLRTAAVTECHGGCRLSMW